MKVKKSNFIAVHVSFEESLEVMMSSDLHHQVVAAEFLIQVFALYSGPSLMMHLSLSFANVGAAFLNLS